MAFYDDVSLIDEDGNTRYPRSKTNSIYDENGNRLDNLLGDIPLMSDELVTEPDVPTDADLLGGHNSAYFEALVTEVSARVTVNLNSINTINANLTIVNGDNDLTAVSPGTFDFKKVRYSNGLTSINFRMSPTSYLGHDNFVKIGQLSQHKPTVNTPATCMTYTSTAIDSSTKNVPAYITTDGSIYIFDTTTTNNAFYLFNVVYY